MVGIFGLFFVSKVVFKPKRVAPSRVVLPPAEALPQTTSPPVEATQKPQVPSCGKLDLSCYKEFYEKALMEGKGSCEWSLNPSESGEEGLARCEEATAVIRSFSGLQWGQVVDYVSALGYSFSLSGNFFAQDLGRLENLTFSELKLSISGELRNFNTTLTGFCYARSEDKACGKLKGEALL